jgi:predicted AlkP superfamily phosphohydrolase/phosphomutase
VVTPGDYDRLLGEIGTALSDFRHPESGAAVIARLHRTNALYEGPFLSAMPDLVFDLRPNFAPGIHCHKLFEPTGWVSGDHNLNGFIVLQGSVIEPGALDSARLIDVAPTIYRLLGLPIPGFVQGQTLVHLTPGKAYSPPAPANQFRTENVSQTSDLTAEEEQKLLQQLRDLGYS